jgi:hypothetical protein
VQTRTPPAKPSRHQESERSFEGGRQARSWRVCGCGGDDPDTPRERRGACVADRALAWPRGTRGVGETWWQALRRRHLVLGETDATPSTIRNDSTRSALLRQEAEHQPAPRFSPLPTRGKSPPRGAFGPSTPASGSAPRTPGTQPVTSPLKRGESKLGIWKLDDDGVMDDAIPAVAWARR